MSKKITVERYGIIHCIAQCSNCAFETAYSADGNDTPQDVRNAVYKHIRQTGHSVIIETGAATKYGLE